MVIRQHVDSGKLKPGPLQEQQRLLPAELSPQPNLSHFKAEPELSSCRLTIRYIKSGWEAKRKSNAHDIASYSEQHYVTIHC